MVKNVLKLAFVLLVSCGNPADNISNQQIVSRLDLLIEARDYFNLKAYYGLHKAQLSPKHSLYYSAMINNVFNNAEKSNADIDQLIADYSTSLSDTLLNKLYRTKLLNHVNLYEYADAARTSSYIQSNYLALNDSSEVEMLQNEINIWEALKDVPKQQTIKTGDAIIPMTKDKFGLFNIDVTFGDATKNLLFDTGANFSVLTRSLAKQLGYSIIEADFYVTAATGKRVKSDIAIAPDITIGGINFKNVMFLVLDDENLSFPQVDYYINGAIGFPVIESMDEIGINKQNQIIIPRTPAVYAYNNFALDGLMPVIAVEYQGDTLSFNFDTGAKSTSLYHQFYKDYRKEIESNYVKTTFKAASAGGAEEFEGYRIPHIRFKVGDAEASLDSLQLHIENIGSEESKFHGNLGQDYIKQFDEMIISFKYSSIIFK